MNPIAEYLKLLAEKEPGMFEIYIYGDTEYVGFKILEKRKSFGYDDDAPLYEWLTQDACDEIAAAMGYVLNISVAYPKVGEQCAVYGGYECAEDFAGIPFGHQAKDIFAVPAAKRAVAIETLCAAIAHKHGEPK